MKKGAHFVKEIQIQNFRNLKNTGLQKIAPITVLVGENSSGKSTFLRLFPLLKQSISKRTSGPILWAGDFDDYVDFGSFKETVTNDGSDHITIRFKFDANLFRRNYRYPSPLKASSRLKQVSTIDYSITIKSPSKADDYVSICKIQINHFACTFDFDHHLILINGTPFYDYSKPSSSETTSSKNSHSDIRDYRSLSPFPCHSYVFGFHLPDINNIREEIANILPSKFPKDLFAYELFPMVLDLAAALSNNTPPLSIEPPTERKNRSSGEKQYIALYNTLVSLINNADHNVDHYIENSIQLLALYASFDIIESYIASYFENVHYIAPLRATAERYYRLRNLAVDEVDYQGKNLAVFINSMSPVELSDFQKWTSQYFGFSIGKAISAGHISLHVKLTNSSKSINLSDTGFGYSQVLPIITQLWELSSKKTKQSRSSYYSTLDVPLVIAIEQPELHLHPAMQVKLTHAFLACIEQAKQNHRKLQLIIETHSETIVNCLGQAIAKGEIQKEDVSLLLFERNFEQGSTTVHNSEFDDDGYLTNWPYGFFDAEG